MPRLTLITHVYNAQAGVDHHLRLWQQLDPKLRERLEFLIIDDCSSPPLSAEHSGLNLRLLRVNDDIDWNMPGCRNLGAIQARADWLLYFDVDNITTEANIGRIVEALPKLDRTRLYVFRRMQDGVEVDPHINTFLVTRWGYFRAGGYDEDFAGHYGYEDVVFRNMWRTHVGRETLLSDVSFDQLGWRTSDLNRDTQRNHALAQSRLAAGLPKPKGLLRFDWDEVGAAPLSPKPASMAAPAIDPERKANV